MIFKVEQAVFYYWLTHVALLAIGAKEHTVKFASVSSQQFFLVLSSIGDLRWNILLFILVVVRKLVT